MSINFLLVNNGLEETPDPRQKKNIGSPGKNTSWPDSLNQRNRAEGRSNIFLYLANPGLFLFKKKNTNKAIRSCKNKTKRISFLPVVRICWVRRNEYSASWPLVGEAKVLPFCQWLGHQPVEATQVSLRQWRVAIDLEISKSQLKRHWSQVGWCLACATLVAKSPHKIHVGIVRSAQI